MPLPANDLSPWAGTSTLQRRCECGSWSFALMLLDDFPRLVCSRCETDHTEAMFPVRRMR